MHVGLLQLAVASLGRMPPCSQPNVSFNLNVGYNDIQWLLGSRKSTPRDMRPFQPIYKGGGCIDLTFNHVLKWDIGI